MSKINVCECCGSITESYNFISMLHEIRPALISTAQNNPEVLSKDSVEEILSNEFTIKWKNEYLWPLIESHIHGEKFSEPCEKIIRKIYTDCVEKNTIKCLVNLTEKESLIEIKKINHQEVPTRDSKKEITLITSIYAEKNKERFNELKKSILSNVKNELIDKIVIFVDQPSKRYNSVISDSTISLLKKLGIPSFLKKKVDIIVSPVRLNYEAGLKYVRGHGNDDSVYLLCNSDCYFDKTVGILKKINYTDKFLLSMTRQDEMADGSIVPSCRLNGTKKVGKLIVREHNEQSSRMPPYSSDAWAFTKKTADLITTNFSELPLGTLHCEQQFLSALKLEGLELYNIGFHGFVNCIHIHNSEIRYVKKNLAKQLNPKLSLRLPYRTGGNRLTWHQLLEDPGMNFKNFINGTCIALHPSNYLFDNRYNNKFGSYVVRDIRKLFKYH
jgi:hypothetical protein